MRRIGASTHHESNSSLMEYPGLQREEQEVTRGKSRREEEEDTEGCSHQDGMETQTNERNGLFFLYILSLLSNFSSFLCHFPSPPHISSLLTCVLRLWLRYFLIVKLFSGLEQREYFLSHSNELPPLKTLSLPPTRSTFLSYPPLSICLSLRSK